MPKPKFVLIGTFYQRYEQSRECIKRVLESSKKPDEFWIMCETKEDALNAALIAGDKARIIVLPTPKEEDQYSIVPYSNKINYALDRTDGDIIAYLDNGSMPHRDKYKIMYDTLVDHPLYGAVYCTQHRTGFQDLIHVSENPIADPYAKVNYTQAMHRKTDARWTLDMQYATPNDLADAIFWRDLSTVFYPVPTREVLDVHKMDSSKAAGL